MHVQTRPEQTRLTVANAEVEASAYLAERLGLDVLDGMPIALGWVDLDLAIPAGAEISGLPAECDDRPIWPQSGHGQADVTLTDMSNVVYQGTLEQVGEPDLIKTAPSATLKNESTIDVPWIRKFTSHPDYPFDPADQHPYLVWNLYRIADGRIEMLAESGVKHAFFTVNWNCDFNCQDGNVLWPGCEDTYSSGNNDTASNQGPRDEIEASVGLWDSCGSFFDPDCTGSQTQNSGQWGNRLLIDPAVFQQPDTDYFMDAWYVIQYDVNIWNSMGFRPIDPEPEDSGWTMNPGKHKEGPVISQWVPEDNTDPMADHDVIVVPSATPEASYPDNMPQGHLRLLVKVNETSPGRYRYNYALQNYDFDRAMEGFRIDLPDGVTVHDTFFGDIDDDARNDWDITVNSDHLLFEAPPDNPLTWFTLFNFEVETDAPPVTSEVRIALGDDASQSSVNVRTIAPSADIGMIFGDRFRPLGH
ncbi:MAG: hypothetical protein U5L08_04535 [Xanthomonadales bacterium]|nr:hypothetical protein [Xanthomonadales bacterium]